MRESTMTLPTLTDVNHLRVVSTLDRCRQLLIDFGQTLTEMWMRERATMQQVMCHPKVNDAMQ